MKMNTWLYDEFRHCGVDYSKAEQAGLYDEQHQKFRDYEKEFTEMLDFLKLQDTKNMTLLDLGCGTGAAAILAANWFKTVYAVDVSEAMIAQARKKLNNHSHNLKFVKAGFLSYKHEAEPVDVIMTRAAFHHLPDFWKQIALLRMNNMLKMDGILYMCDVVFHFNPQDYASKIHLWIAGFEKVAGENFRLEIETHIRDEYSTFNWIMQGMLEKAGFVVEKYTSEDDFLTEYACRKVNDLDLK